MTIVLKSVSPDANKPVSRVLPSLKVASPLIVPTIIIFPSLPTEISPPSSLYWPPKVLTHCKSPFVLYLATYPSPKPEEFTASIAVSSLKLEKVKLPDVNILPELSWVEALRFPVV